MKQMKAIVVEKNNKLNYRMENAPTITDHEVLIDVHATAVNRADLLQRKGKYPPPAGVTEIMGLEASGIIVEKGQFVKDWKIGDRVCALLAGGGYGQLINVPDKQLFALPNHFTFEEGAALPEALFTAYLNLFIEGELLPNEDVLIHAGGSGIGTIAIQLAKALGHCVMTTASDTKCQKLSNLGADLVIKRGDDFLSTIKEFTDHKGVDVILDPVGASYLDCNVRALAPKGRLILIGLLGGFKEELALDVILRNQLRIKGSLLRTRSIDEKAEIRDQLNERIIPLIHSGKISPIIDSVFNIEEVDNAHERLKSNQSFGKIVLTHPR